MAAKMMRASQRKLASQKVVTCTPLTNSRCLTPVSFSLTKKMTKFEKSTLYPKITSTANPNAEGSLATLEAC